MKKFFVLLLAAVISATSLAGCGSGKKDAETPPTSETSTDSGDSKNQNKDEKDNAGGEDKQTGAEADGEKADETDAGKSE